MKNKTQYICLDCKHITFKWVGRCPQCAEWNSLEEYANTFTDNNKSNSKFLKNNTNLDHQTNQPKLLNEIRSNAVSRLRTNITELDRVLGGGLVTGSLNLLGGEPGIGKSTLLLLLTKNLSDLYKKNILYISGEESEIQIAKRAERLNITSKNLYIYHANYLEDIIEKIEHINPKFLVIDSIQTTISGEIMSTPGSISQVKEVTYEIMNLSKSKNITTFIISHINKSGTIAGPKVLEHMVDSVLFFEGDQYSQLRILRGIKNRYGSNNEVGLFEMSDKGLIEILNPSKMFLCKQLVKVAGKSITSIMEGSRPLFVEVQSLVIENKFGNNRRNTQGIDQNRLFMLIAVIEKFLKIDISVNDIYLNIVGGLIVKNRDSDLAIIVAIVSSFYNISVNLNTIIIGEVGLTGEIREVEKVETRIKEATKLGFKTVIVSDTVNKEIDSKYNIKIARYKDIFQVIRNLFSVD